MGEKQDYYDVIMAARKLADNKDYLTIISYLKNISGYDTELMCCTKDGTYDPNALMINEGARRLYLKIIKLNNISDYEMESIRIKHKKNKGE